MQAADLEGVYREMAELVGVENAFKIFEHFKGQQRTFPQKIYNMDYVKTYVKKNYDGTNLRMLAKKFNYSERRIRQILKETLINSDT